MKSFWRWVRLVVVLALVLLAAAVFAVVAGFGFAGGRGGWVPTVAGFLALALLGGWLGVTSHWPRARVAVTAGLAAAGLVGGALLAHHAPPTPGRLRHAIETVRQPDWVLLEAYEDGSTSCFDYCLEVVHRYEVPRAVSVEAPDSGGDVTLTITVEERPGGVSIVEVTAR